MVKSYFTLYTLHFTLYILHFTLYTLHFTLYTVTFKLHFTLYTKAAHGHTQSGLAYIPLYTLHFTLAQCNVQNGTDTAFAVVLYTLHSEPLLANLLYTLHFTLDPPCQAFCFTLYTLHFTG